MHYLAISGAVRTEGLRTEEVANGQDSKDHDYNIGSGEAASHEKHHVSAVVIRV